ncbi:CoA transferase subunit A [Desulfatirhabdium butyrativorans]|uniref:CoA transferase subunit A n=1 Tax=Desulfatirhabdium butyrativorans TaxID=340467 RepID=UPI000400F636|nr:CoA-transferase [Desulfatirhabdium butyrativorans]
MPPSKLLSLSEAVQRFVPDGSAVALGLSLETAIPFAFGHEVIRQNKRNLTLIGPISDILFDQLIGAGCAEKVRAAWVGNVITGIGYNYQRAAESRSITVEHHSNFTISLALKAAAMGVTFLPSLTALGSDILNENPSITTMSCPFTGKRLSAVAAIRPDVAVVQVQRSDTSGNAHVWGCLGITREACMAAEKVLLLAEEIVSSDMIFRDPNRVLVPGFRVSAVAHVPWGAHPSPMPGYYNRDHEEFLRYKNRSKRPEDFEAWLKSDVHGVPDRDVYMRRCIGEERMQALAIRNHSIAEGVDYGY